MSDDPLYRVALLEYASYPTGADAQVIEEQDVTTILLPSISSVMLRNLMIWAGVVVIAVAVTLYLPPRYELYGIISGVVLGAVTLLGLAIHAMAVERQCQRRDALVVTWRGLRVQTWHPHLIRDTVFLWEDVVACEFISESGRALSIVCDDHSVTFPFVRPINCEQAVIACFERYRRSKKDPARDEEAPVAELS